MIAWLDRLAERRLGLHYRWYDLQPIRRVMLARFWRRKHWHPERRRLAILRYLYWVLVRGHDSEICARCGGPVRLVFHVPDRLWEQVAGFPWSNARTSGGEAAAGVLCPPCVAGLYRKMTGGFLRWTCNDSDEGMVG